MNENLTKKEEIRCMSKKKEDRREAKSKEGICPICNYDCHDKESLQRHMEWVHKKVDATE